LHEKFLEGNSNSRAEIPDGLQQQKILNFKFKISNLKSLFLSDRRHNPRKKLISTFH